MVSTKTDNYFYSYVTRRFLSLEVGTNYHAILEDLYTLKFSVIELRRSFKNKSNNFIIHSYFISSQLLMLI